ncbi:flavin monoamine oxidase family protein [Paenibacillus sp. JCM 10914]|uniref:flavin monoamine oxidase family protein n=1 Tax=Paenibacillus sp. JCM 10914 TaxID=1236974 RepID=UPI0003CC6DC8|nr:flavin monoamine oxidase family protein [Paenibacillus sp. JCM 10914]GAE09560.1 tryptophan 2-monooxygenase [Paenibacillus sp. JCM 10914]
MTTKEQPKEMTRRQFLTTVGKVGGSVAVFSLMGTMGLFTPETLKAAEYTPPGKNDLNLSGRGGKKVIILGAGIAGLTAAYELGLAGYDCTILEAKGFAGGRCWTVRKGTSIAEIGSSRQTARFDQGLYFNAGPMRIPQFHVTLDYCRKFGVPIEPFNNVNESGYYYNENVGALSGQRVQKRAAKADVRGYVAEMLAKAVNQNALDLPLTAEEKMKLVDYLKAEGDLNPDLFYRGSERGGYKDEPGSRLDAGILRDPFDLKSIINSGFGRYFSNEYGYDQQMMMFHPVGGMDAIIKAFEKRLGNRIKYRAEVKEIRQSAADVRIVYTQADSGKEQEIRGDYCICTIPLSVLKKIPADFSPEMKKAISSVGYASAGKIGLQFKRRFWEEDEHLYGGNSLTNMDITQIYYPPTDYFGKKGILLGYYTYGSNADKFASMTYAERERHALAQGAKIHPQYPKEFEASYSIDWKKTKYQEGGWVSYSADDRKTYYPTLCKPDNRIYLAGEHISYITAWQAGAIESAREVVTDIHQRVMKA